VGASSGGSCSSSSCGATRARRGRGAEAGGADDDGRGARRGARAAARPEALERIGEDLGRAGIVGELDNKLVSYLAATSRKLEEPLAVVIQSSSAAGKSSLMEAVLVADAGGGARAVLGDDGAEPVLHERQDLKHKILAIVEEEGAERASYALKLLQSEGELTIASTGKDPRRAGS
jgi:DNA primase